MRDIEEVTRTPTLARYPAGMADASVSAPPSRSPSGLSDAGWTRRHLLGLEDATASELHTLLDRAQAFRDAAEAGETKHDRLRGRVVANLFFEPSTRTKTSFSIAAKRLGADTVDFTTTGSSLSKGETFLDTAATIEAMGVDLMVVRHRSPGAPAMLARHGSVGVLNAGDGTHEHPTQALLDLLTIRQRHGRIEGLTVGLVGDILHSRVARSNLWALTTLGARVIVCGPSTLVPAGLAGLAENVTVSHDFDAILPELDVVNLLRVQFERQRGAFFPSIAEYAHLYAMNADRLARGRDDLLVLAPGPINRGVEITPAVADGPQSAILQQVSNGLYVRMAALSLLDEAS